MIDGSVMAAYLAAAVISADDRRLAPAMTAALDRLRACVRVKMGADPAARLLNPLAGAYTLEAVGSAFNVAVSADHEFARQLSVIFDELGPAALISWSTTPAPTIAKTKPHVLSPTSCPVSPSSVKHAANRTEAAPGFVSSVVRFWPGTAQGPSPRAWPRAHPSLPSQHRRLPPSQSCRAETGGSVQTAGLR